MKLFIKPFAIIVLVCGVTYSCSDYLDISTYFDEELKLDSVFSNKRNIEAWLWGAVSQFPDEGRLFYYSYTPGPYATDEAFTLASQDEYGGIAFVTGGVTSSNLRYFNNWGNLYKIIRKCNTLLARIDEAQDWTTAERLLILGYTRFIRAYAYYYILIDFGPPILVGDELLFSNEALEYYDRPRALYDEAVDYICMELEESARFLPYKQQIMNFGRPTKGAAYGLIARLRLFQASPLFNGGQVARTYYGNWIRKVDGKHYISQTYDESRWAVAAAAAKRVIDLSNGGEPIYKLYTVDADERTPALPLHVNQDPDYYKTFPEGAGDIDPFRSFSEIFTGETIASINPEYVWGRYSDQINEMTRRSFPISCDGWSECCVTQKVIDAFRMIDGRTIYDSSEDYPYSEIGFTTQASNFSGYQLNSGVSKMYFNREPRFYASVGFSECYWPMSSTSTAGKHDQTITYYYDSPNGKSASHNNNVYTATGYVSKKNIHFMDAWSGENSRRMTKSYGIIRLPEMLLSYVEALNNLTHSHSVTIGENTITCDRDPEAMKKAFNLIRHRAGLPGLTDTELSDPPTVQKLIEQERMIEFMHENRRYYDVRRWGIYEATEKEPVMGMNVDAPKDGFYQRVVVNSVRVGTRVVNKKMVFLPIPRDEVKRLPSFDQNPGWED